MEFAVQTIHQEDIDKDNDDKDVNGALVGKPETELEAPQMKLIEEVNEEDGASERGKKPDAE